LKADHAPQPKAVVRCFFLIIRAGLAGEQSFE
jgi:hypothetical protein